jgi:hypothetical protein
MMPLKKYLEFCEEMEKENYEKYIVTRNQELSGLIESGYINRYAIEVTIPVNNLLIEHEQYKKFARTNNLWRKDPANLNIPVQGHYHIVDPVSKEDIYSVNMDGTAHHRVNRGFEVPKKEAEELRKFGVTIPANRIIECIELTMNESFNEDTVSYFFIIEGD